MSVRPGGILTSRALWIPTGTGSLVSTTPDKDATANAAVSWGAIPTATYRSGFIFTSSGAGAVNSFSAWKANFTMPTTKRFVLTCKVGARTTNIQPIVYIAYQDITHCLFMYRSTTNALDTAMRNNASGTGTNYSSQLFVGVNTDYAGEFQVTVSMSAVASGPLGEFSGLGFGTSTQNSCRNSFAGVAAPHASWASGSECTVAFGCSEITTTPDTTHISDIGIFKHPLDE